MKIGMLGFGTVGRAVYENYSGSLSDLNAMIEIAFVRSKNDSRVQGFPDVAFTTDPMNVVSNRQLDIIVDVMGNTELAKKLVEEAFKNKKHVVTANKELVEKYGLALQKVAAEYDVLFLYEASVGGGVPIIRNLKQHLIGKDVSTIVGIINGTSNYVLSLMTRANFNFAEAISMAQLKGFAEKAYDNDINGYDARSKLIILARTMWRIEVLRSDICTIGISNVSKNLINDIRRRGYALKPLVLAKKRDELNYSMIVAPFLIPLDSDFSRVNDEYNVVKILGNQIQEMTFSGPGAGGPATAVSVFSDLSYLLSINKCGINTSNDKIIKVESVDSPEFNIFAEFYYDNTDCVSELLTKSDMRFSDLQNIKGTVSVVLKNIRIKPAEEKLKRIAGINNSSIVLYPILEE